MKYFTLPCMALLICTILNAQNVGIGETTPTESKLQVKNTDSAVVLLHNSTATGINKTGLFFKTGSNYSGSIATIGSGATFRMGLFTYGGASPSSLLERLSITDGGNIGIGTTTPTAKLEVNGLLKLTGGSPGAGKFLISDNTGVASWYDLSASLLPGGANGNTIRHNGTSWVSTSSLYNNGTNIGIGTAAPNAPLSFASTTGNKIALWGDASGGHYGIGIQGSLLQLYGSASNADIAFGYGSSTAFTERMRIKGNGNVGIGVDPSFPLDAIGRIRLRDGGSFNSGGIWLDGPTNTLRSFIGTNTDNTMGFYGTGTGWNFLMDVNDGAIMIGNSTPKATGYLVNVGGKIIAEEVRVQLKNAWPDYVFEKNYAKLSINELEKYVAQHKHLPNIPSAKDIEKDGQQLGEIQRKMLEKIEELSLYIIELNKKIKVLEEKNNAAAIQN